ncbi:histidine kinase [Echinicola soli]|uniref:Histidine kinase n=1 Tax=Echinicola soli TaxID=2591634 RepID=A0A514CK03_9BACT|nr:histidine kinase [Echinicola soli]QDH80152.1 histidine kinase [Echinicola soli]
MKERALQFKQTEWWMVSGVFFLIILTNILGGKISIGYIGGENPDQMARYFSTIFIPAILFAAFYFMHMKVVPIYQTDGKTWKLILFSLLIFILSWLATGAFYMGAEWGKDMFIPFYFAAVALYVGYMFVVSFLKKATIAQTTPNYLGYNISRLVVLYVFLLTFLFKFHRFFHELILIIYAFVVPSLIVIFIYNYFLVYRKKQTGQNKASKIYYWLLIGFMAALFLTIAAGSGDEEAILVGLVAIALLVLVINPISNALFHKYQGYIEKMDELNVQLVEKTTDLKQLRNQINPHFLFNALNTIYGISLQENAEKTAESIQKLGDMMRFMLHENTQETIPLNREIDYLINYVDLQQLRIEAQENISIEFSRKDEHCKGNIAPMLLIPFIENAFKHGISLQKKSWVRINLRCLEGSLHMDIHNSIHLKNDDDPEKHSGIGLPNVRQRLQLLYPERHELVIRENDMEYFVHLSIQMNKS